MLRMFIFQLEYFSSRKNFCNTDEKKYFFFQNKVVMQVLYFLLKKLMEPPFTPLVSTSYS
jgi:surface polysaccharide O-acyltransferase-like enzyme